MDIRFRRSKSLDNSHLIQFCRGSGPLDIPTEVPWPEKCAWHRTGSLKAHFVHLSDTVAIDDIHLTGFRPGSVDSTLVSSASEKSDSSLALVSDSDEGKENDSTKAVENSNQQKGSERSVWYISSDPVSVPTSTTVTLLPTNSTGYGSAPSALSSLSGAQGAPVGRAPADTDLLSSLPGTTGDKAPLTEKPPSPEKKVLPKTQPKGTLLYEVKGRDSLESIAAHYDTTPSELKKLNRLVSRMIFPGQVLYIPDPDYVCTEEPEPSSPELSISPPLSPPPDSRVRVDVPLVRMADRPPEKVPGHVERQLSTSSQKEPELPHKLSEEEAQQLDQECFERFIKINVKHITDGQGVVTGTLIVTPNAVMFDPNVSDPLVIEQGAESYGMITPMDMVISAAMYHDIAAMRLRGKRSEDQPLSPRPEVYHDRSCPLFHGLAHHHDKVKDVVDAAPPGEEAEKTAPSRSTTLDSLKSESNSVCSCGVLSHDHGATPDSPDLNGNDKVPGAEEVDSESTAPVNVEEVPPSSIPPVNLEQVPPSSIPESSPPDKVEDTASSTMGAVKSKNTEIGEGVESSQGDEKNSSQIGGAVSDILPPENIFDISSIGTDVTEDEGFSDDANVTDDKGHRKGDTSYRDSSLLTTDNSDLVQFSLSQDDPKLSLTQSGEEPKSVIVNNAASDEASAGEQSKEEEPSETRIGSIVYLPIDKNEDGTVSVRGSSPSDSSAPQPRNVADETGSVINSESQTAADQPDAASFRPFQTSAKHLSNFVNYATGLFRKDSEDQLNPGDVSEVVVTSADKTPIVSFQADRVREVESAIKLADKPELFQTFDKLIARPAARVEDPPLYLCLRVGHPKNKEVSQTCPIESYRTTKKKPEYWFSIPRDKVDQLYAFFVQWTPEIYGDEDDIDPEKRGFVVIEDEDELGEEHLEIVDEHFSASIQKIRKDWEIISKEEAIRRMSTIDIEEQIQLPDMVGETKLLTEDELKELSQNMPARTIGYTWNLIYSTEVHGFSLKTLYRDMSHVDSPILLVVADTNHHVFGAVTNCAFKMSDHFYGTGECFLYTFYPEFKVFHWTGENNFFIKGNKESLAIGAGQGQFGLWLDGDLYHGRSHRCDTFDNDVLTDKEDFVLKGLEAWAFL